MVWFRGQSLLAATAFSIKQGFIHHARPRTPTYIHTYKGQCLPGGGWYRLVSKPGLLCSKRDGGAQFSCVVCPPPLLRNSEQSRTQCVPFRCRERLITVGAGGTSMDQGLIQQTAVLSVVAPYIRLQTTTKNKSQENNVLKNKVKGRNCHKKHEITIIYTTQASYCTKYEEERNSKYTVRGAHF